MFGTDWFCNDWKSATSAIYKPLKNIQKAKRIICTRITAQTGLPVIDVRCESSYRCDAAVSVNILKKGQKHSYLNIVRTPTDRPLTSAKLKDIHNLICVAYGDAWKDIPGIEVYNNLKSSPHVKDDSLPVKDCECGNDDIAFTI